MIIVNAVQRTLCNDENVMVEIQRTHPTHKLVAENSLGEKIYDTDYFVEGKVMLKIGNKITPDMYVLIFDESDWYALMDEEGNDIIPWDENSKPIA